MLAIYGVSLVLGISAFLLTVLTTSQAVMLLFILTVTIIVLANKIGVIGSTQGFQQRSSKM
ncbi:hypothetical protein N752_00340 [Desulforamulus aquiferis]|nr:hypothetical protein N752_00340 [Desulforamulus aquiferis]